ARDEVRRDLLEPEAQANAERAAEHGERRQVDPHDLQQQQEDQHEQADLEQLRDDLAGARVELRLTADDAFAGAARQAAEPEEQHAEEHRSRNRVRRQPDIADLQRHAVEVRDDLVEPAENMQRRERYADPLQHGRDQRARDEPRDQRVEQQDDREALRDADQPALLDRRGSDLDGHAEQQDVQDREEQVPAAEQRAAEAEERPRQRLGFQRRHS